MIKKTLKNVTREEGKKGKTYGRWKEGEKLERDLKEAGLKPEFEKWLSKLCYRTCSNEQFIRQHMKNKKNFP